MPRRRNTKPTFIYWLVDMRPEIIASGYAGGYPFYCGKTVKRPVLRLYGHFGSARRSPLRPISVRLNRCTDQFVRMIVVEMVPYTIDWSDRERHWIRLLRFSFPDNVNVADGGSGAPGLVLSAERRAAISAFQRGKITPPETRAKMSAAQKGRIITVEHRNKMKDAWKIRSTRPSTRLGSKHTAEQRARISASKKGKPWTEAQREARTAFLRSRVAPNLFR